MTYVNLDNHSVKILSDGLYLGSFDVINLISGSNITVTPDIDQNNKRINVTITGLGGGSGLTQQQVEGLI